MAYLGIVLQLCGHFITNGLSSPINLYLGCAQEIILKMQFSVAKPIFKFREGKGCEAFIQFAVFFPLLFYWIDYLNSKSEWLHACAHLSLIQFQCFRICWLSNEWISFCKTAFPELRGSRNCMPCSWNLLWTLVFWPLWQFKGMYIWS